MCIAKYASFQMKPQNMASEREHIILQKNVYGIKSVKMNIY